MSRHGSIDWYCPERFDAPAVFCRILDSVRGGYFSVRPSGQFEATRSYRGETNVLDTTFRCEGGAEIRVTDFMPVHRRTPTRLGHDVGTVRQVLRLIEGSGSAGALEVRFKPTFDFGRGQTELRLADGKGAIATHNGQSLVLYAPKLEDAAIEDGVFTGRRTVKPGEHCWLVLSMATHRAAVEDALDPDVSVRNLERTLEYWQGWSAACRYEGDYRDAVLRSALALKLMTYEPTGAVVAAPTTSLPELIGGVRNWDYRFTWLRDASLILYALSTIGYHEEATDFIGFLARTCGGDPEALPQIMYTIDGKRHLPEHELEHLEGYRGSAPVRTGNGASHQHQLDIFGDVLSAAYHFRHTIEDEDITPVPEPHERMSRRNWQLLSGLVEQAAASWPKRDSGIWEMRREPQHHVYSKLMCWVAVDRGIRLAEEQRMPAPLDRWRKIREDIREAILKRGYNPNVGAFTQAFDGHHLDASVLAIPRFGFLPATDERMQSTIDRIRDHLTCNGLIERYRADDGLPGSEGTFALCSFWMVDALAMAGRLDEARELFERLLSYANDVGLMSEEIDPVSPTDTLLGNFPQGFSHTSLISSAVNLAVAARHGAEVSAQTDAERAKQGAQAAASGST